MSKFNVGDRIRRTGGTFPGENMYRGNEYTVAKVDGVNVQVEGTHYFYHSEKFELVEAAETAIDPSYYQFPGGHEVRHISAHLTGFGSQALQYVARSTRLDGKNKGDTVENLQKAVKFLEWEIERIKAAG